METLQSWAVCAVICILAAAVIQLFFPDIEKDKSVRVLVSAFMLSALLSPLIGDGVRLELPELESGNAAHQLDQISDQINRSLEEQAVRRLEKICLQVLEEAGVRDAEITVNTDILDDGHIQIEEIVLTTSQTTDWGGIAQQIEEKTGCPVRVKSEVDV